ncbi:MAG TPA: glycoside hydrolase family 3 C-terminal domain-containing protein, partial [Flavisolibacter sp.]|nr:glycoside hydrolase family 3 C-terminal domain-containing protein [Flavisolibacter sp.]
ILEALQKKLGAGNVTFVPGVAYKMQGKYFEDSVVNIDAAVNAAANADYVLLCIGENSYTETPGNLNSLEISDNQLLLANALQKTGKPVVLILNEGRPRIISRIEPGAAAVVDVFLPGNYGADALADVLTGTVNPSGKLPITYPRYTNDLAGYLHKPSEGSGNPQGGESAPQYPFGFGLSYTTFAYSNFAVAKTNFSPEETATFTVTVTNTGNRQGKEVVQLYLSDLISPTLTPDYRRLRAFEKVDLKPGESKTVTLRVPIRDLAFVAPDLKKHLEAGEFNAQIGNLQQKFSVTRTLVF